MPGASRLESSCLKRCGRRSIRCNKYFYFWFFVCGGEDRHPAALARPIHRSSVPHPFRVFSRKKCGKGGTARTSTRRSAGGWIIASTAVRLGRRQDGLRPGPTGRGAWVGTATPGRRYAPAWAIFVFSLPGERVLAIFLSGEWAVQVSSPVGRPCRWTTVTKQGLFGFSAAGKAGLVCSRLCP